ncbi:Tripartite tricarboxylate transporter family receptor [Bordetella pertussis]|nr:Tripartite tricarboxylate transporter family receptor [Bordetella pertussis]
MPTFREAGVDLAADGWNAFFAPAAMPADKVERLGRDIAAVMSEPAMQQAVRAVNLEPVAQDAAQTAASLQAYRDQWEPVVRQSGFTATQ